MRVLVGVKVLMVAALLWAPAATGDPRFDRSFGTAGTALAPLAAHPWHAGIYDMARAPGGRLIAAGEAAYHDEPGIEVRGGMVAAFQPNGQLEPSFGSEGLVSVNSAGASGVAVQPDGKAVVVGYSNSGSSPDVNYRYSATVRRLNRDGSRDRDFKSIELGSVSAARDVAVQRDGRIVVVGTEVAYFRSIGAVIRLLPNGRIDRSFGRRGRVSIFVPPQRYSDADISDVIALPDGRLLVTGVLQGRILLARLLPDGRPDPSFGGGDGRVAAQFTPRDCTCSHGHAVRLQSDGRIVVAADDEWRGKNVVVARFHPDGRLDRSFGPSGRGFVRHRDSFALGLAVQRDDEIVVAGQDEGAERSRFMVLRYLPNGRRDRTFGRDGAYVRPLGVGSFATSALVEPSGRVVVGGVRVAGDPGSRVWSIVLKRFSP